MDTQSSVPPWIKPKMTSWCYESLIDKSRVITCLLTREWPSKLFPIFVTIISTNGCLKNTKTADYVFSTLSLLYSSIPISVFYRVSGRVSFKGGWDVGWKRGRKTKWEGLPFSDEFFLSRWREKPQPVSPISIIRLHFPFTEHFHFFDLLGTRGLLWKLLRTPGKICRR